MGARHGSRPASRPGRSRGRGARARPEPRAGAPGAAGAGGVSDRAWATLRARAGLQPGRCGRRRERSPLGQVRGPGGGDLCSPICGSTRFPPTSPGGGGAGGRLWARPGPRHYLHVPVCRSQQPGHPVREALPRHPFGLGDRGGARGWSAWMHASAPSLGHITPSSRVCLLISDWRD